jgi:hypothetical protein
VDFALLDTGQRQRFVMMTRIGLGDVGEHLGPQLMPCPPSLV